jgi:hypothetical protein
VKPPNFRFVFFVDEHSSQSEPIVPVRSARAGPALRMANARFVEVEIEHVNHWTIRRPEGCFSDYVNK